ncbi:MAG: CheR family methyltransferase, partial [Ferruginibacter sp.]
MPTNLLNEGSYNFPVIGIGASAGGLDAFKELVHAIPQKPGMSFLLMQHLDPSYDTALAEILQRETILPVIDLSDEIHLEADHIYIVPANKILVIHEGKLQLELRPGRSLPIHSIDIFLSALAEIFQSHTIGILLSGMGADGTLGLKTIKDHGGVTFVQSISSAKYPSMPQHALNAEVVDFELAPAAIPAQLLKVNHTLRSRPEKEQDTPAQAAEEDHFKEILHLLRIRRDVDFTYYKQTTIRRRILRRMLVNKVEALSAYLALLQDHPAEQDILYQDLLIPVTAFFRDAAIFENLCEKLLPAIFENRNGTTAVRLWIAGCSTGEEAYSIAICLHEYLGDSISGMKIQLFATDISEKAIQKARIGSYRQRDLFGVSEKRLEAYFIKTDGYYQVTRGIRDLCVFATHNFLKDPPFANMDFISCRNVLIYMESYLQRKALGIFHYALNEKGFLLLGKSETAGNAPELFKSIGTQEKLYVRKPITGRSFHLIPEPVSRKPRLASQERQSNTGKEDFQKNADDILLSKYTPAGVIVNEHSEIVQFRGSTGAFLEASPGRASLNILKMAREGLSFEIRNALHKSRDSKEVIIKKDIPIHNGKTLVTIEVVPLLQSIEPHWLILFKEELQAVAENDSDTDGKDSHNSFGHKRIQQLEKDLSQLREDMRTITEDQEASNEELQSANEELLSGSEELQSLNEEMETSKEEIQSTNEELMTVNQELFERNEQYNQARQYSEAIIASIHEPLLVLTRDLRIKSANQTFVKTFGLKEEDIAGKILFELQESKWDIAELRSPLLKVQTSQLKQLQWEIELMVPVLGKRIICLHARPVQPENSEQLILLAFEDITLVKNEAKRFEQSANKLKEELVVIENFFLQAPALFCVLRGPEHIFEFVNPRYDLISGSTDLIGKKFADAFPEFDNEGYKLILDEVYKTGKPFLGREMQATHFPASKHTDEIYVDLSCQPFRNDKGIIEGVLFFSYEVTEQVFNRRQMRKDTQNLEEIVNQRTNLLQAANSSLEQSNKNLQEFAS